MANDIKDHNIKAYGKIENTEYILNKYHQSRIHLAIDFIKEFISKYPHANTSDIKLLSIACSTGIAEEKFLKLGLDVHGIDGAEEAIKEASKRGIKTKIGDITEKLPYDSKQFDIVYAGEVIEHLLDTRSFLQEIYRVLKPNGLLIITTPNLATLTDRIKFLFGKAPRQTNPMHEYLYLHIRPFTFSSLKEALTLTRFRVIGFKSSLIEFKTGVESYKLAKMLPHLGKNMIVASLKI